MNNQTDINNNITEYIKLKSEKNEYQEKLRQINDKLQYLETMIKPVLAANPLNVQINQEMFNFKVKTEKRYSSITFKYLEDKLRDVISDEDDLKKLIKHLKNGRTVQEVEKIVITSE
jgi:hypothetical protein